MDLIAFGAVYGWVHGYKDEPSRRLGWWHRQERHEWYQRFGRAWDFDNPFPPTLMKELERYLAEEGPELAEAHQADIGHDYWDRTWDSLGRQERKDVAAVVAGLIRNPDVLRDWAGVDVVNEKVKRLVDGVDIWEDEPGLRRGYLALRQLVESRTLDELV